MKKTISILEDLFLLSESRGKEAAGLITIGKNDINIIKMPISASEFIKSKDYLDLTNKLKNEQDSLSFIGHSRLVTNGTEENNRNNQPILRDKITCVHNGIIVNDADIWEKYPTLSRQFQVDTEVVPAVLNHFIKEEQCSPNKSIQKLYAEIVGNTTLAITFQEFNNIVLATNNGSLWILEDKVSGYLVFGSESYICQQLKSKHIADFANGKIYQVLPNNGILFDLTTRISLLFNFEDNYDLTFAKLEEDKALTEIQTKVKTDLFAETNHFTHLNSKVSSNILNVDISKIDALKRCTKCLLPHTFPFIEFDDQGVCNICLNYEIPTLLGRDKLDLLVNNFRKDGVQSDCILPFSGGRDSSYALHYIVKELGLKPVAYTYDWGMVTDIARRNIARMCGDLGIEHILVSADIRQKRLNIRKNILAWLKNPQLGMIPLFMAGDKQYFTILNDLIHKMDLKLSVYGENLLEKTNFKTGFCGVNEGSQRIYDISAWKKVRLALYYAKNFIMNPAYINSSLLDSFDAFKSSYVVSHDYLFLYNYIPWLEEEVNETLIGQYGWETSKDTNSTWRIGDGTAAFYNYIYYKVAGFTEFDTFRSNQIRQGMITREQAIAQINEDNLVRFDSILWYCNTVGLDFQKTIERINNIPTLY